VTATESAVSITPDDLEYVYRLAISRLGLAQHHIDSYNELIDKDLTRIVQEVGELSILLPDLRHRLSFTGVSVEFPTIEEASGAQGPLYPLEARLRGVSYSAPIFLEFREFKNERLMQEGKVKIGEFPIMVKSRLCRLYNLSPEESVKLGEDPRDPGGYFIINGSEKVIVGLEDFASNRIFTERKRIGSSVFYTSRVFSSTVGYRTRVEIRFNQQNQLLKVYFPGVGEDVPFVILMRALGREVDKDIAYAVSHHSEVQDHLMKSFEDAVEISTVEEALDYIGGRTAYGQPKEIRIRRAEYLLDRVLLPHLGTNPEDRLKKTDFLGKMAERCIAARLGWRRSDDKDHYKNKRLRFAGPLIAEMFRQAFRRMVRDLRYQIERSDLRRTAPSRSVSHLVSTRLITDMLSHAIATGNWGRRLVGVSQLLERTNYLSTISHLRRIQSTLSRSQANFEARDLHPTQWGRIDPAESPEGSNCGLVKNVCLLAQISVTADVQEIQKTLESLGVLPADQADENMRTSWAEVYVSGVLVGYHNEGKSLVKELTRLRRRGRLSSQVNMGVYTHDYGGVQKIEVIVNADPGRPRRPLVVVEDGTPRLRPEHIRKLKAGELTFDDLVDIGVIEYLDAEEEEMSLIAPDLNSVTVDTTHLEMSPLVIFGAVTSIIPFAEHNQSPRNTYEGAMAKQALGYPTASLPYNFSTTSHYLIYPQVPLVTTDTSAVVGLERNPIGQNFVVAILSDPYDMEDALVLNKASVERGLARSASYFVYEAEARLYAMGERDRIQKPEEGVRGFRGIESYSLLDEDGTVGVETKVAGGDVIVGRTSPPRFLEERVEIWGQASYRRDTSLVVKPSHSGHIDSIILTEDTEQNRIIKVRIRDTRIPEVGDKFASRAGQKGVVGAIVPQEDMPFTASGLVPDALINPHAIPSRMTIGHFLEAIFGKAAAISGRQRKGDAFVHEDQNKIFDILKSYGLQPYGEERMINGTTGLPMKAKVFIGPTYYQRLHHMVKDKIHARARGQITLLTHQPTEGRARGGGLRFGEMERDCLVGHGASRLLQDRLLEESDKTTVYVCENCGTVGYYDSKQRKYVCRMCGKDVNISAVSTSYAFKLLLQEITSLGIYPRINLSREA